MCECCYMIVFDVNWNWIFGVNVTCSFLMKNETGHVDWYNCLCDLLKVTRLFDEMKLNIWSWANVYVNVTWLFEEMKERLKDRYLWKVLYMIVVKVKQYKVASLYLHTDQNQILARVLRGDRCCWYEVMKWVFWNMTDEKYNSRFVLKKLILR
jgi:hypothetical protein